MLKQLRLNNGDAGKSLIVGSPPAAGSRVTHRPKRWAYRSSEHSNYTPSGGGPAEVNLKRVRPRRPHLCWIISTGVHGSVCCSSPGSKISDGEPTDVKFNNDCSESCSRNAACSRV